MWLPSEYEPGHSGGQRSSLLHNGFVMACAAKGGGVSYTLVHQASMTTSWAMPVSMV